MSIARELGLSMGVIYILGALGLVVLPEIYWPTLQLSFALLALIFVTTGLGLIGLSTSRVLWGEPAFKPWPFFARTGQRMTIRWPHHCRTTFKLKGDWL